MGPFHSRKKAQKGEIFRDPEPIAFFPFAQSNEGAKGNVSERNQHRPTKDTRIRPVQSRTSPMILTNNYQRVINLGREGPMTTPTQTKGQRSSLGLTVTSTPFSDLNAGYGPRFTHCARRKWYRGNLRQAKWHSAAQGSRPTAGIRAPYMGGTYNKQQ